jgi:site-specific recombinase XerD
MRNLNTTYRFIQGRFKEWMQIENYKPMTVKAYLEATDEFFKYLMEQNILSIQKAKQKHLTGFKNYLMVRPNKSSNDSGIANMTINGIIKGVNCLVRHINAVNDTYKLDMYEDYLPINTDEKIILTPDEVMQLYHATYEPYTFCSLEMGQRDRAMIAIFYACGLRLNEGRNVNIADIDFKNKKLHVRKGKLSKERYVPIPSQSLADIETYIQQSRDWFKYNNFNVNNPKRPQKKKTNPKDEDALFIGLRGERLMSYGARIEKLRTIGGIDKKINTHALRHSVATHLMLNGWELKKLSKFLGHASIDSTQIYLHIAEQIKNDNDGK